MMQTKTALVTSALAVTLYGCASLHHGPTVSALKLRPAIPADSEVAPGDLFYGDAVAAINRRDYARALDLLQAARERAPGDVRILNAFGVIYDKLGRFDLSQRYYAEAQAADPSSAIVAQNLAYSKTLQADRTAVALAEVAEPVTVASSPRVERASPTLAETPLPHARPVVDLAQAAAVAPGAAAVAPGPAPPLPASPARIVAAAPVETAAEPFVVRLTSAFRGAAVQPTARPALASAQPSGAPTGRAEPKVALAAAKTAPLQRVVAPAETPARIARASRPVQVATVAPPKPSLASPSSEARSMVAAAPVQRLAGTNKPPAPPAVRNTRLGSAVASATRKANAPPAQAPARSAAAAPRHMATLAVAARPAPQAASAGARASDRFKATPSGALLGRPVLIIYNGAGRRRADQLHAQLSRRGWSLSIVNWRTPAPRVTTVRYDASAQRLAQALARSLRIPVKLERCQFRCTGVTILVGEQVGVRTAATVTGPSRKLS
jgi:hypothetical protein